MKDNMGMIYTSYYDNIPNIDEDIVLISIAGRCKSSYTGIEYKKLAPKKGFFYEWKQNKDNNFYIKNYYGQVLDNLNPTEVVEELFALSKGKNICLLCWEPEGEFCHRHIVAKWLISNGYCVQEYIPLLKM